MQRLSQVATILQIPATSSNFTLSMRSFELSLHPNTYPRQGKKRMLSPDRADPFADSTPAPELSTYAAGGTQS